MTEAEIILLMVKCVPVVLAVWVFMHLLCDEYLRALESRGLIRRRTPKAEPEKQATASDGEGGGG